MLEEKLKSASKEASQNRVKSSLKIIAVAAATATLLVAATLLWQHSASDVTSILDDANDPTAAQNVAGREDFKDALKAFEKEIEPLVSTEPFMKWNGDAQHHIFSSKDKAISLFSSGDYGTALGELESASRLATSELQAMNNAFEQAISNAQNHFAQNTYDKAKIEITKALKIRPQDPTALALEAQIDALPRVLELTKAAHIARAENDLKGEAANLRLILALAPQRSEIRDRLQEVEGLLKEQKFSDLIKLGLDNVGRQDLRAAQQSLAEAKRLFPERDEVSLLSAEVEKLHKTVQVQKLLRQASAAIREDNWEKALALYSEAGEIEPNNQVIIEGNNTAQSIISLSARIDDLLKNAHRLGSPAVATDARNILRQSTALTDKSPALSVKATHLDAQLQAYGKKVPLLIRSDNETNIVVRGVGKVGQTKERYIELKPGTYTFEGMRPGYKSQLVHVSVEPNATDIVVEVVCNERL